ncbi:hypothetical protein Y025_4344 [Burkholderia pseudomallei TSV32]|nr:hypothetical protein Y025_4344 [Burkholderia pseudomallei TSV32]
MSPWSRQGTSVRLDATPRWFDLGIGAQSLSHIKPSINVTLMDVMIGDVLKLRKNDFTQKTHSSLRNFPNSRPRAPGGRGSRRRPSASFKRLARAARRQPAMTPHAPLPVSRAANTSRAPHRTNALMQAP